MSICNQPCLVASVMFDSKHRMYFDLLVILGCILEFGGIPGCRSHVIEDLVLLDLVKFKINCLLPLGDSILLVHPESILAIYGNFQAILIPDSCSDLVKPGLLDSSDKSLGCVGKPSKSLPSGFVQKIMFLAALGTRNRVIHRHFCQSSICDLPHLPFN